MARSRTSLAEDPARFRVMVDEALAAMPASRLTEFFHELTAAAGEAVRLGSAHPLVRYLEGVAIAHRLSLSEDYKLAIKANELAEQVPIEGQDLEDLRRQYPISR